MHKANTSKESQAMPRPAGKCLRVVQRPTENLVDIYLSWKGCGGSCFSNWEEFSNYKESMSALEIIESLSVVLDGHPASLMLGVAASLFPEYCFQYSRNPKDSMPVIVMTKNGPKSLYQVAKEVCKADKQKLSCPKEYEGTFESLLPDCSDRPYMLDVFQELLNERKSYIFGYCGFISRFALLFRDDPAFLRRLNTFLATLPNPKLQVMILEKENGPSPALSFYPYSISIEYVSREGCRELLDRVEHHRLLYFRRLGLQDRP